MLRMGQKRAIHGEGHRHSHALVFGNAIAYQHMFEGFLRRGCPAEQPPHVPHCHCVIVLDSKRARIIECPIAHKEKHGQSVRSGYDQSFEAITPAGAARASECAGVDGTGVFYDFELRMFAVGNDVFGIQLAVRNDLGEGVHDLRVWTNRIRGDDVDIRQTHRLGNRLTAGQQIFTFVDVRCFGLFSNHLVRS